MKRLIYILLALTSALPSFAQSQSARSITIHRIGMRGWMGVGVGDITPDRAKALKLASDYGVEVFQVEENSPASRAGLKTGDVILEIDGQKIPNGEQFVRTIGESAAGTKMTLTVWRGGFKQVTSATLEARPAQMPIPPPFIAFGGDPFPVMPGESPIVGFEGESLTPQLAEYFGVKDGVLVRTVVPHSPAEKAGLKAGDVIIKVAGTPVTSPREISGLIRRAGKGASFTVMRNHKQIQLNVEIAFVGTISGEWQPIASLF